MILRVCQDTVKYYTDDSNVIATIGGVSSEHEAKCMLTILLCKHAALCFGLSLGLVASSFLTKKYLLPKEEILRCLMGMDKWKVRPWSVLARQIRSQQ